MQRVITMWVVLAGIGFLRGQVIKYQWRLGKKDSSVQDNQKAIWYANKLNEVLNEQSV